jgi:hypothetical protein
MFGVGGGGGSLVYGSTVYTLLVYLKSANTIFIVLWVIFFVLKSHWCYKKRIFKLYTYKFFPLAPPSTPPAPRPRSVEKNLPILSIGCKKTVSVGLPPSDMCASIVWPCQGLNFCERFTGFGFYSRYTVREFVPVLDPLCQSDPCYYRSGSADYSYISVSDLEE